MSCNHSEWIQLTERLWGEYAQQGCMQTPAGIVGVDMELPELMKLCPWCGEEITRDRNQNMDSRT